MSETPETDAVDVIYPRTNGSRFLEPWVRSDFARKLERERDEARAKLECLLMDSEQGEPQPLRAGEPSDFEGAIRRMRDAERERDKARRTIADMHAAAMGCIMPPRAGLVADMVVLREENKTNFCLMEDFRRETQQLREEIERIKRGECIECANYSEDVEQAKRERDEARIELEMWRDGNILHEIHRDELEKVERERDQARRELDIQLEGITFHMERDPVREHPLRADDAPLSGEEHERSDTPQTDLWLKQEIVCNYEHDMVSAGLARTLERERDEARADFKYAVDMAARFHEDADRLLEERDEQTAQMCQAIGHLSTIAEDCEAWLNGESDEPSMEFIKLVAKYAREALQ